MHHDPTPAKPGSQLDPTNIDSEADLPTELTEPSGLTDAEKNQDHYGSPDPWYKYTGANDTSAVIKAGTQLTAQQQKELAQYALALINSFRKQHGLKPILMSDTVQELGDAVVNLRIKDGTPFGVHTDTGSAELDDAISKVAGGNQYDVINGGENLDNTTLAATYDTTMLQLKVELLQGITGMCYADGFYNWGHRANFLSHTYGSQDEADQIYMSFNIQNYKAGAYDIVDSMTYLFDFWAARTDTDGTAEKALSNGAYSEYVNHGYDSVETNPAYTQAVNDYNQALAQVASANKAYTQANYNANSTASASKLAQQTLVNAKAQLKTAQANLANAKTKLANAEKALADATAQYGDQLNAYNAAKAAQLAKDLANAKQALADNQSAIATSDAKIKSLKDQSAQLQAKLAKDEKTLADAKAAAENNGSDTDNNGDDSNTDPDNNNSGSDDNHNNGSDTDNNSGSDNNGSDNNNSGSDNNGGNSNTDPDNNNSGSNDNHNNGSDTDNNESDNNKSGSNTDNNSDNSNTNQDTNHSRTDNSGSNVNNSGSDTNSNDSDHSFSTNSELITNGIDDSDIRDNDATTNNLSFVNSRNSSTITPAQVAAKTINQKQLPQTGDQTSNQEISLLGMIGLALSSLGLISISKRKHN